MRSARLVGTALAFLLVFTPATGRAQTTTTAGATPAAAAAVSSEYRIGRDDQLDIVVLDVPELTRTVQVDSTGHFTLPIVGRVDAVGRTADEIASQLTQQLGGRYLNDPQITVVVKQAVSQRVTVNGAVAKPGVYPLTGPTTLLQALALANGADLRIANLRKVAIFRNVDGQRRGEVFDLAQIQEGKTPDPPVQADDVIVVDQSGTKTFFAYFGSALNILNLAPRAW